MDKYEMMEERKGQEKEKQMENFIYLQKKEVFVL
jgi:hypothetical protein